MKCKQERKRLEGVRRLRRELLKELKKMNPKRDFLADGNIFYVNTYELWKLKIPEAWKTTAGEDKAEVKNWGMRVIENGSCVIYIHGR